MPALIRLLTQDGLKPADYTADSLAEAAQYEPDDGVYTVTNTYNTFQTLKLNAHLDRLEDSARRADVALQLDRARLRAALRQMIAEAGYGDVRFRITVPRATPDQFILTIEPFTPPSEQLIQQGVRCITAPNRARQNAAAKTTGWMHARQALSEAMPPGIYDTFLLDAGGYILEGLGSNFYAIWQNTLHTAGEGVLRGIAQQVVFEIAPDILPLKKAALHVDQLAEFQEAFLTSSSRGIIPVVEVDGIPIADGKPGTYTLRLREAYTEWVSANLRDL